MKHIGFSVQITIFVLFALSSVANADLMYFHQGGVLEGKTVLDDGGDSIAFRLVGGGELVVSKEAVREVIKEEEYAFYVRSGDFWLRKGNKQKAKKQYDKALELAPENQVVLNRLHELRTRELRQQCEAGLESARELVRQDEYWDALREYEKLFEISPTEEITHQIVKEMAETHAKIAFLYYDHIYRDGALKELAEALNLDPDCSLAHYVSGRMHRDQGDLELAIQDFRKAYELDSELRIAQDYLLQTQQKLERKRQRESWIPIPWFLR